jgi:hypothetical protein
VTTLNKDIHQEVANLRRRGWCEERKPGSNVVTLTHEATGAIVRASLSAHRRIALSKLRRTVREAELHPASDAERRGPRP